MAGRHDGAATSGAATSLASFAGILLITVGILQILAGTAALAKDDVFVATGKYLYAFDLTTWGWIHVVTGAVVGLAGLGVLGRQLWGRVIGVIAIALSAIANFLWIPYTPWWSITIIAMDVVLLWALITERDHG